MTAKRNHKPKAESKLWRSPTKDEYQPSYKDGRRNNGRPRKLDDTPEIVAELEKLGRLCPTLPEIAAYLGIGTTALNGYFKEYPHWRDALERGNANAKISLRRSQIQSAEEGNVTAQIWLGKQLLGQSDQTTQTIHDSRSEVLLEVLKKISGSTKTLEAPKIIEHDEEEL